MATHTLSSFTVPNINGTGTLVYDDAAATLVFTPADATQAVVMFSGLHAEPPNVDLAPFIAAIDAGTLTAQSIVNSAGGVEVSFVAVGNDLAHAVANQQAVNNGNPNPNPNSGNPDYVLSDLQLSASTLFNAVLAVTRADNGGGSPAINKMLPIALATILPDGTCFDLAKLAIDSINAMMATFDPSQVPPGKAALLAQLQAAVAILVADDYLLMSEVAQFSS